jgi:SAM-dependent methyltransferase
VAFPDRTRDSHDAVSRFFVNPEGTFIGDFEAMYRECSDPWLQSIESHRSALRNRILSRIRRLPERRVLDIGCGNGAFSERMRLESGAEVFGLDVAPTAITNARSSFSQCRFEVAAATEVARFAYLKPTAICMLGITWCILDSFREVLNVLKKNFEGALLFHVLTFYAPGKQKYGREFFTNLEELLPYFSMMTVEKSFTHSSESNDGSYTTLIITRI